LGLLGEKKGTIVNLTTGAAIMVFPTMSSYSISKLASLQLTAFVTAENPNVTAVALHPGIVMTEMTLPMFFPFAKDTPELIGGLGVWLATDKAAFLTGKYIESNWSVDDLTARKDEIVSEGKLTISLKGEFGKKQFK
jgi:NAD(P)-dependent dehydrogenase (short-subunit alcohol dehydrogenase family)